MKISRIALAAFAVLSLCSMPAHAQGVPGTMTVTGRLVSDGEVVTGTHTFGFRLYDVATVGNSIWSENTTIAVTDGLFHADLGSLTTLDATIFDGSDLWLEVIVDNVTLSPRLRVQTVPYAFRASMATTAETVGSLGPDDLQHRVTGTCGVGSSIRQINSDGTVTCQADTVNSGDITGVSPGAGLAGGGVAGDVSLAVDYGQVQRRIAQVLSYQASSSTTAGVPATSPVHQFCALTEVATNINTVNGTFRYCLVQRNSDSTWVVWARSNGAGAVTCTMTCF